MTNEEIHSKHEDMIRNIMTHTEFATWAINWIDLDRIIRTANSWKTELKQEDLINNINILNGTNKATPKFKDNDNDNDLHKLP